jgi:hypothetical protein
VEHRFAPSYPASSFSGLPDPATLGVPQ